MEQFDVKKQEADDYKLLQEFNEQVFKLKELGRREGNANPIDASGLTKDNQVVNMELKARNCNINTYDTLMLETHKGYTLLDEYIKHKRIPLYINFMQDGNVAVFNLLKAEGYMKRETTHSKLYGNGEYQYKQYLPLKSAWIYKKQNNKYKLIQKGW